MKTVEILSGRGPFVGPVVDLELNPDITAVSVKVRTAFGEATVRLDETDWDHAEEWSPMATTMVGRHQEKTLTAKVNRDSHELVRWSMTVHGGGPYWVHFDAVEKENENVS